MNFTQCIYDFSTEYGLAVSLLLAGLLGSFTHCAGMCTPFVLAQSASEDCSSDKAGLVRLNKKLLLPYHAGRITTYIVLAVVFHSILNLASLFGPLKAIIASLLLSGAATIFLISVWPAAQKLFPWAARVSIPLSVPWIERLSQKMIFNPGPLKRYALGVLLGFMPCGLVIAAIMAASTAPNMYSAGFAMAAFGLGTVPALVAVSLSGAALQMKFPQMKLWLKPAAGIISTFWLFALAGWMII